jgi:integrase
VPLNIPAQEILRNIPRKGALLFPNEKGSLFNGWSKSKAKLDKAASVSGWRIHDLRRTLATGLQRLGVRLEVTEAVLNHVSGSRSGIVGVYQRHDWANEKRAALDGWAAHVAALDSPSAVAFENVVRPAFGPQLAA